MSEVRLCNGDYKTPGVCYVAVDQALPQQQAVDYCDQQLHVAGTLAVIEGQAGQDLVAEEIQKQGWNRAWINGIRIGPIWHWSRCKIFIMSFKKELLEIKLK